MNEVYELAQLIDYREHQISSRSLSSRLNMELPITIFAADAGESISEEQTSLTKLIQVIDGSLKIIINGEVILLEAGEIYAIPADTFHELQADSRCKFLQIEAQPKK